MTGRAFADFVGHWHSDRNIPGDLADGLYVAWAGDLAKAVSNETPMIVLEDDEVGRPVGFLALRRVAETDWDVPLTALDPAARGMGLLGTMLERACETVRAMGGERLMYETQINNMPALRAATRIGFRPLHARFTLHSWLGESRESSSQ